MYNKIQKHQLEKRREELKKVMDTVNDYEELENLVNEYFALNKQLYEINSDQSGKRAYEQWTHNRGAQ